MPTVSNLTVEEARRRYVYNPITGEIRWQVGSGSAKIGDLASSKTPRGYITVGGGKNRKRAHQLAWAITYGVWADNIDHKNLVKHDNRICNLRVATQQENNRSRPKQSNNKSGFKGVHWAKTKSKWEASSTLNKKTVNLGYFDDLGEARNAYVAFAKQHHQEFFKV